MGPWRLRSLISWRLPVSRGQDALAQVSTHRPVEAPDGCFPSLADAHIDKQRHTFGVHLPSNSSMTRTKESLLPWGIYDPESVEGAYRWEDLLTGGVGSCCQSAFWGSDANACEPVSFTIVHLSSGIHMYKFGWRCEYWCEPYVDILHDVWVTWVATTSTATWYYCGSIIWETSFADPDIPRPQFKNWGGFSCSFPGGRQFCCLSWQPTASTNTANICDWPLASKFWNWCQT